MPAKRPSDRRCSYVVVVENDGGAARDLRDLATYLSSLGVGGCEVVILDSSPRLQFELNGRVLRWVGRHVAVRSDHGGGQGGVDVIRAALVHAACEKVIVAAADVRYSDESLERVCELLDVHEAVEPQDYPAPGSWWGSIESGRILIHRALGPGPDHGATLGFRRTALRAFRSLGPAGSRDGQGRRLATVGAEVHAATEVFVRRESGALSEWLASRPRLASDDFLQPVKTAFFFALLPLLVLLAVLGGTQLAGGYAAAIALGSVALAIRGRFGAASFFPFSACVFAPLWVLERSLSVYWALFRKLRGTDETASLPIQERPSGDRVAAVRGAMSDER